MWSQKPNGVINVKKMNAYALEDQDQDFQLGVPFSFTQGKGDSLQIRQSTARLEGNKIIMDQNSIMPPNTPNNKGTETNVKMNSSSYKLQGITWKLTYLS